MKIIRAGKKKDWWVGKIGTCGKCDTQVEIEESDVPRVRFGYPLCIASFPCPVCNGNIWVYPDSPWKNNT